MMAESVLDAYQRFAQVCEGQVNPRLIPNLRTALRVCILPQCGIADSDSKRDLESCLAQIPLDKFVKDATPLIKQSPNSEMWEKRLPGVSQGTAKNYRSVLTRFLGWINEYKLHPVNKENYVAPYAPPMPSGKSPKRAQTGSNLKPYAVQEKELPDKLRQQLEQLQDFWINPHHPQRHEKPLKELTFSTYKNLLLSYLGWLSNIQHVDLETVDLLALAEPYQLEKFVVWGVECRNNSYSWALKVGQAVTLIAKQVSQYQVSLLHDLMQGLRQKARHEQQIRRPERNRTLSFEECVEILNYLRQCCADRNHSGDRRSELAIIRSWQRYLIIALLTYCPLKQRDVVHLDLSKSVFEQEGGELAIVIYQAMQNGARKYQYTLPQQLSSDLADWINHWRPKVETEHKRIFIRLGSNRTPESLGQPLTDDDLSEIISLALRGATVALFGAPLQIDARSLHQSVSSHLSGIGRSLDGQPFELAQEAF